MVNVVEVPTDEGVEVWEGLSFIHTQMRGYCTFRKWVLKLSGGGSMGEACGVGYFLSMRGVYYYLRVSQKRKFVFLVKLKHAPALVDGDRMLGENEIY